MADGIVVQKVRVWVRSTNARVGIVIAAVWLNVGANLLRPKLPPVARPIVIATGLLVTGFLWRQRGTMFRAWDWRIGSLPAVSRTALAEALALAGFTDVHWQDEGRNLQAKHPAGLLTEYLTTLERRLVGIDEGTGPRALVLASPASSTPQMEEAVQKLAEALRKRAA